MTRSRIRVRSAAAADVPEMVAIKMQLRLASDATQAPRGGFLLGCSAEQYQAYVAAGSVVVLEECTARTVVGFAVALPDHVLRGSEFWVRAARIQWVEPMDLGQLGRIAYIDQLAVRPEPRYRMHAPALAAAALLQLQRTGHEHAFATVVSRPLRNPAPLPLLAAGGGRVVGRIEETYPEVGEIVSDVYHLRLAEVERRMEALRGARYLARVGWRRAPAVPSLRK